MLFAVRLVNNERGQAMVEYGLVLLVIAMVAVVGFTAVGTTLLGFMNTVPGAFK